MFERGECGHQGDRIVRIGTNTGKQAVLAGRLAEHFENENKDRSVFRKHIGRALLSRDSDPYLDVWNIDFTSRANRDQFGYRIDSERQKSVERRVTAYLRESISVALRDHVVTSKGRVRLEKHMIGTVAQCPDCGPSADWLGRHAPDSRIAESGLWQVQHLNAQSLLPDEVGEIFD